MGFAKYVLIWIVFVGSWFNLNVAYPMIHDCGPGVLPDTMPLSVPELVYDYELIPIQPSENKDTESFLLPPGEPESLPPDVELVPTSIMMKGDGKPVIAGNDDGSSGIIPPDVEIIPGSYIPMTYYFHHDRRPGGMIPSYFPGREPPVWTIPPNVELVPSKPSHPLRPVVPAPAKPSCLFPTGSIHRSALESIDMGKECNCTIQGESEYCQCPWDIMVKLYSSMQETEHSLRERRISQDEDVNSSPPRRHERRASVDTTHEAEDITPVSTEQTEIHKTEHVSPLRKIASLTHHSDKSKRKSSRLVDRMKSKLVRNRNPKNVKSRSLRAVYSEDGLPELSLVPAQLLRTDNSSSDDSEISTEWTDYEDRESDSSTLSWDFEGEIEGDAKSVQPKITGGDEDFPTATSRDNGKVFSDEIEDADLLDYTLDEVGRLSEIEDADAVFDDDVTESSTAQHGKESDDGEKDMEKTKAIADNLEIVYETTTMLSHGNPEHRMRASLSDEETGKDMYDLYDS